jgi:DNA repair protein RadC
MPDRTPLYVGTALIGALGITALVSNKREHQEQTPTVEDLEEALHQATAEEEQEFGAGDPAYDIFLKMNESDVPDHLLIAVLLAGATRRSPVNVALDLLHKAEGDLSRITRASIFEETRGVGPSGRARLLAAKELARRAEYRKVSSERKTITSPIEAVQIFRTMSLGPHERLAAIYLDRRRRVVGTRILTIGSDAFTIVDPKQVLGPALDLRAHAVILAHNHPSGDPYPSPQDAEVTHRVAKAGQQLGIRLLDHLILGATGRWSSLAERGELPSYEAAAYLAADE